MEMPNLNGLSQAGCPAMIRGSLSSPTSATRVKPIMTTPSTVIGALACQHVSNIVVVRRRIPVLSRACWKLSGWETDTQDSSSVRVMLMSVQGMRSRGETGVFRGRSLPVVNTVKLMTKKNGLLSGAPWVPGERVQGSGYTTRPRCIISYDTSSMVAICSRFNDGLVSARLTRPWTVDQTAKAYVQGSPGRKYPPSTHPRTAW